VELQTGARHAVPDLTLRRSGTIGLIVGDVENPFFHQIIGTIESTSYDSKRRLVLCNSDEDAERERFHLAELVSQGVDGIIIVPVGSAADAIASVIETIPVVCLDRRIAGLQLDLAMLDNELGSRLAVQHFVELGHSRIAMITTRYESCTAERTTGYLNALADCGIAERPEYVRQGSDVHQHTGYEQMLHLLRLAEPPTAVLIANHLMTLGAMLAVRDRGLRIPQDVSLVGFDDTPWSRLLDPPLTTIAQPCNELGKAAANFLIDRLDGSYGGPPREIILPPSLIVRSSTCAPAPDGSSTA
jgi:DNA-binding LacI/PurR family transcriptional regulator